MSGVKALGLTEEVRLKLFGLSTGEEDGIPSVEVKFVDIGKNTCGESACRWSNKSDVKALGLTKEVRPKLDRKSVV